MASQSALSTIDPGQFVSPFLESEDTVRARLLAAMPDGMSQELGTWSRDWVEINVAETLRKWSALGQLLAQCFPSWATGQQLDAHALSYGLQRGAGFAATGLCRFFALGGTAIPPGTIVEIPQTDPNATRIRFQTTNPVSAVVPAQPGYVDVAIVALDVGVAFDAPPNAISQLDSNVPNVQSVTNTLPITGGEDPQVDDDLRQNVLEQAADSTGSGTVLDYFVWGRDTPGVSIVAVYTQWDVSGETPGILDGRQNGSVLLVLRDPNSAPVDYSVVQAAQVSIGPSRQLLATFETNEGWDTAPSADLAAPAAPTVTPVAGGGTITAGTNGYVVVPASNMGYGPASPETQVVSAAGSANEITWELSDGATAYFIFGRTVAGELLMTSVDGNTTTWTDTGAITPQSGKTVPAAASPSAAAPAAMVYDDIDVQIGQTSLQVAYGAPSFNPQSTGLTLTRAVDLSRFAATDVLSMWIKASDWSKVSPGEPWLKLITDPEDYFYAPISVIAGTGTTAPTTGSQWWQWIISFDQLQTVGSPDLGLILSIELDAWVNAACQVNFDYLLARYAAGELGEGGLAPVGADITCITPALTPIDIQVTNALLQTGYTLVDTPGNTNAYTLLAAALQQFFLDLQAGENIRFNDVAQVIHDCPGFIDFTLNLPAAAGTPPAVAVSILQQAQLGTLTVST